MPTRKEHERRDLQLLGERFTRVHKFKDFPRIFLKHKHRVWFHDPVSDIIIGIIEGYGDPKRTIKAIASALMHDIDDFTVKPRRKLTE